MIFFYPFKYFLYESSKKPSWEFLIYLNSRPDKKYREAKFNNLPIMKFNLKNCSSDSLGVPSLA